MKINLMEELYNSIGDDGSCSLCRYKNRRQNEEPCSSCMDCSGEFKLPNNAIRIIYFLQDRIDRIIVDKKEDVMPTSFIPDNGGDYFYLSLYGVVHREKSFDRNTCSLDIMRAKSGNCFRTSEELERLSDNQKRKLWDKFYKLEDET